MGDLMCNFVISLKQAEKRRRHIESEFGKQAIPFGFFDAITPEQVVFQAQRLGINIQNTVLSTGELACLLSHVSLWQYALEHGLPHITIFEDDVYLGNNAQSFLGTTAWIPPECHVLKLEGFATEVLADFSPTHSLPHSRKLFRLQHKHMGAAGYVLSQHAVQKLIAYTQTHQPLRPVDHIVFDDYLLSGDLPIFQMLPALCVQDYILNQANNTDNALPSYLEQERFQMRTIHPKFGLEKPIKLGIAEKIKREIMRPVMQLLHMPSAIKTKLRTKKVTFG